VQAKLNYYNPHHNLLTKLFTAEYSLWFDVSLTGLQALNTTIPLGGTSNHFRTKDIKRLQGWDPFNVTEDADLGIRLFNEGYKTAIIDSTTYEEANSRVKNWIRQRSRWIKGYMQTYLVHTRKSIGFQGKEPKHALLFHLLMGGKISFILINPFLWIATISYFVLNQYVGETIEYLYPSTVFYMAVTSLVFGNFLFIYYYMIGVIKREQWNLVKYVLLIPFYWILISVAGYMAIYQLLFKPHYWEKTIHGFHLKKAFDEAQKNNNIEEASIKRNREIKKYSMLVRAGLSLRKLKYIIISNSKDFIDIFSKNKKMRKNEDTLRILIFNWRDTKHVWAGGAEAYVHEIAKRWVADGMSVTLFCGNDGHEARNQVIDGVRVIRRGGFFTVYFWAFIYYIFRLRGKYDVIIDAENGIPFLTPLYVRKPIYLLIHHVHQDIFRLHLSFPLAQIASFLEGKVMPFLYRKRTVITVSESSRNEIIKLGFDVESIHVIHPGINREQFFSIEKAEHPVFSYIGRLKPYKNINTLIYAMQRVVEQNPRAKLFIAGDGECESEMRELVQKLHMEKHIFIMGKITEKQKTQLFGYSWAAIQPSQVEGWGITVIEANACSTPVIASNVNGLRDSIIDKKTGILVEVNSIDKLAEAMIALITGSDLRKQLSKEAYRWSQKFHWDESARLFIMLIRGTEVL
jgi:glycosyltransferase involved in cell wall biosynthesis